MFRRSRAAASIIAAILLLALSATTVLGAATIHSLDVTFSGDTVTATGDISGLGSQKPATAQLEVVGFATYTCTNKGGNAAPGQNPVPVQTLSPEQDLGNTERNGRGTVNVSATLTAPQTISAQTAGCPSGKRTATLHDSVVTGATLTIRQGNQIVFQEFFDNPNT